MMDKKTSFHIAVIGVDGSGKSSCYEGLLNSLAKEGSVAGIGDKVLVSTLSAKLETPEHILRLKVKSGLALLTRMCKGKLLYEISKLTELVTRSKIQKTIVKRYKPGFIITDGSSLVNILGWGRYYHPEHFNDKEILCLLPYFTGEKKISLMRIFYFLRRLPELVLINKVYAAPLQVPDVIILLKVSPPVAIQRIMHRGKQAQVHERENFLRMLQEAYAFVCDIIKREFCAKVFEIQTDNLTQEEVIRKCEELIDSLNRPAKVSIVATTISGSIKDWKKLDKMEVEFKRYHPDSKAYIVDSHREAFTVTKDLVSRGARIVVSAGGAGTFNSVLEGCCACGTLPTNLRLAFLRKGSADLIGKVLNIPDELEPAAKIISEGITNDKVLESDILEIETKDVNGNYRNLHMIGFGGIGVFGDIPYFTESRFIKYYKGLLGYLFGDRGPFLTGANLALLKRYLDKMRGKKIKFRIIADGIDIPFKNYMTIIIMNGDLGKHFPIAKGIPLGSGDFQVTLMEDRGLVTAYREMIHAWKGDLDDYKEGLGVQVFRTKSLKVLPECDSQYFLNVDGLLKKVRGEIEYSIFSKVKLITG